MVWLIQLKSDRMRENGFKLKVGRFRRQEEIFYSEDGEVSDQVAHGDCECPISSSIQDQVGLSPG